MLTDLRSSFPQLKSGIHYLDTASTALKPQSVIDATNKFYSENYASAGRGSYDLAANASILVDKTREKILEFCGANQKNYDCVFTSGATASLNLVSQISTALILKNQSQSEKEKINIVLSIAEHHSNVIPWQQQISRLKENGIEVELRYLDCDETGTLKIDEIDKLVDEKTAVISLTAASNVTGKVTDLKKVRELLLNKELHPIFIVDACQKAPHRFLGVDEIDADFVAFSAHKLYGPTGIGCLIGKCSLLNSVSPFDALSPTGGGIVELVKKDTATFQKSPSRFEPGTLNMAGIASFSFAIDYIGSVGFSKIADDEKELTKLLWDEVSKISEVKTLGKFPKNEDEQLGLISFTIDGIHPHDASQILNENNIQVRVGHHCAQLIHQRFQIPSTIRASLGIYSNDDDIYNLVSAIKKTISFFK